MHTCIRTWLDIDSIYTHTHSHTHPPPQNTQNNNSKPTHLNNVAVLGMRDEELVEVPHADPRGQPLGVGEAGVDVPQLLWLVFRRVDTSVVGSGKGLIDLGMYTYERALGWSDPIHPGPCTVCVDMTDTCIMRMRGRRDQHAS